MIYRLRIILDTKQDVLRDIEIKSVNTFEDLHFAIINAFDFKDNEMASFYLSDKEWKQGEEITLESFGEERVMKDNVLETIINLDQQNFIYVYDFLILWTFFVEVIETNEENDSTNYPQTIFSIGIIPKKAPEKLFIEDKSDEFEKDELDDVDPYQFY
ncbi:plasmid pRiA4b ORF-3 family protein [Flavobacteriaceae bacterium]|nr:plasmid pRiA4b ORF-3 family protein [Flavobacteriaceae bacterium]MDB4086175.1 plasmid pRiA4b ORF-3 family protein [Flavobacteriaceae bacterium]MDB4239657.1 plasmid pRiA4b ORF-3 family protein [Flavobacteriaceae bacterium]MDB9902485.1 plasmid pRiA4b ORF-3 family protein [Flavobacteriaceae bacterium]